MRVLSCLLIVLSIPALTRADTPVLPDTRVQDSLMHADALIGSDKSAEAARILTDLAADLRTSKSPASRALVRGINGVVLTLRSGQPGDVGLELVALASGTSHSTKHSSSYRHGYRDGYNKGHHDHEHGYHYDDHSHSGNHDYDHGFRDGYRSGYYNHR